MNRATLTARYNDEIKRQGVPPRELIGALLKSDLLNSFYDGRYLPRPLFLGHAEQEQLYQDLANLRSALVSLPNKLNGGDLAAFARAVGMTDVQISAVLRSRGDTVTKLGRADLYADETGFRVLEWNMGSALGGMDAADIVHGLLEHPLLAEFTQANNLGFVETMREQVATILSETGFAHDSYPVMAMTDWPKSYETLAPYMRLYTSSLNRYGVDGYGCHIGQLEVRDGGVWLDGRKVDIIYSLLMVEDLLTDPEAPALLDPLLDAVARGDVRIFCPMDSQLFCSKGALAMLSDEENRSLFEPDQLTSLDRILPWTRQVRPGPVTLEDGRRVDLLDYALSHQRDLALKPTLLHGGQGVTLGWRADTTPEAWEEQVRAALDGPYVIQRRIKPVPELFPTEDGGVAPWIVCWGAFTMTNGYGGVFARATTVESNVEVVSIGAGAYMGASLHALAD